MELTILRSIVEITRHRDLDSLELAFLATLAEMLRVDTATLYHLCPDDPDMVEVVLSLEDGQLKAEHGAADTPELKRVWPHLRNALRSQYVMLFVMVLYSVLGLWLLLNA